ncbi:MAG: NUDIX hydrolase [Magnetococcales bacterium]|nr:NUDIX hydrolase [Magnetococcales bacterium]MBF0151213.1 NUDIX hydrolase [Magnetococcales bacterium]MBF0173074.1 NUDIX hydrolase [Magnetococcales bacterium]MBF0347240.1 NUDIX hydrolase [Magnetococcales bacterium]MBF0630155.1 NUDIX hydrolase [Magnetococcales bacterium]
MSTIETPLLTADIIIELLDHAHRPIVLIERKNPPHGWAIPGGFVDRGERVELAARREALEETGLTVTLTTLLGLYSAPNRDPRFHTVTALYVARAHGTPVAMDDAKSVAIHDIDRLPQHLAFDHDLMLADYLAWRTHGRLAPLREE